jgi:hypothetical protein
MPTPRSEIEGMVDLASEFLAGVGGSEEWGFMVGESEWD